MQARAEHHQRAVCEQDLQRCQQAGASQSKQVSSSSSAGAPASQARSTGPCLARTQASYAR